MITDDPEELRITIRVITERSIPDRKKSLAENAATVAMLKRELATARQNYNRDASALRSHEKDLRTAKAALRKLGETI